MGYYSTPDQTRELARTFSMDFRAEKPSFWWSEASRRELLSPGVRWDLPPEGDPERDNFLAYREVLLSLLRRYFDDRHRVGYGLELWAELHVLPLNGVGI